MVGFIDSLTNAFTGAPYAQAGVDQRAYISQQSVDEANRVAQAQAQGLAALRSGQESAIGAIQPAITQGRADITGGVAPAVGALYGGQVQGTQALTGAVDPAIQALTGGVNAAVGAYDPLKAASQMYGSFADQSNQAQADALGLNGPEGNARAMANFNAGPGFQYSYNKAIDAATRGGAKTGMAASGNTLDALARLGTDYGNQAWQQYVTNLQNQQQLYNPLLASSAGTAAGGVANAALTGGTGAANIYTGTGSKLSDLISGTAAKIAPVFTGEASSLADLAKTGGLASADVYSNTGLQSANLIAGLTNQQGQFDAGLVQPYASTYGAQAAAETGGSQNLWGLGLNVAKLAAGSGFLPSGSNTPWVTNPK